MSAVLARRYYVRGQGELGRGENEVAAESFRAALDLYPPFVSARIAYAVALVRLGDPPRAAQALRAGMGRPIPPRSRAAILQTLGDVLVAGGDFLGAEDSYRQVQELFPADPAPAAGLARVAAKLGRYGAAFSALLVAAQAGKPA
jgi:tetratricopeptide (TPR) repeat protein